MVFNISSDLGLIVIPSIMVYISHIPWKRKMVLIGIFSIAVLTIIAAIMNKYVLHSLMSFFHNCNISFAFATNIKQILQLRFPGNYDLPIVVHPRIQHCRRRR
jgi:cell division protein FtsW (lipid II flippase)